MSDRMRDDGATRVTAGVRRKGILVLGMHRSGTSAFTRLLSMLGAQLPANLVDPLAARPGDSNRESGFWESDVVRRLHDDILHQLGMSWASLRSVPETWFDTPQARESASRLRDVVIAEFGDAPLFVVKDPRMCRFVPLWTATFDELAIDPLVVLMIRNPLEVAHSLRVRDQLSIQRSVLVWAQHMVAAERFSRGCRRAFLRYDRLLEDWQRECQRIASALDVEFPSEPRDVEPEVTGFLNPALRHHVADRPGLSAAPEVPGLVATVFDLLLAAAEGGAVDERGLDAAGSDLSRAQGLFGGVLAELDSGGTPGGGAAHALSEPSLESLQQRLESLSQATTSQFAEWAYHHAALAAGFEAHRQEVATNQAARLAALEREFLTSKGAVDGALTTLGNQFREIERRFDDASKVRNDLATKVAHIRGTGAGVEEVIRDLAKRTDDVATSFGDRLTSWETGVEQVWREVVAVRRAGEDVRSRLHEMEYHLNRLEQTMMADRENAQHQINVLGEGTEWLSKTTGEIRSDAEQMRVLLSRQAQDLEEVDDVIQELREGVAREAELRAEALEALGARLPRGLPLPRVSGVAGSGRAYRWWDLLRLLPTWVRSPGLRRGLAWWREAREIDRSGAFDVGFYLARNPDVARSHVDPVFHWVTAGVHEGRSPSHDFDTRYYLARYPDAASSGLNPLVHFLRIGAARGYATRAVADGTSGGSSDGDEGDDSSSRGGQPRRGDASGREGTGGRRSREPEHEPESPPVQGSPTSETSSNRGEPEISATPDHPSSAGSRISERGPRTHQPRPSAVNPRVSTSDSRVRLIAFYLPQFHPIPENDQWWGEGFTEWTNVARAQPLFVGHYQPVLPRDLGFYDLRAPEILRRQAELAREYGVFGFCIYVYWFSGRRLLERPLETLLADPTIDIPFCICWANENWTRAWDGEESSVLIAQHHSLENDVRFLEDHLHVLADSRYIHVDGMPLVVVYRADLLDDPVQTAARWRQAAREVGLPGLHLCAVGWKVSDPRLVGFDAIVEFPPHSLEQIEITDRFTPFSPNFDGLVLDYEQAVSRIGPRSFASFPVYRGVMPAWDNTPRRGTSARVFWGATPERYRSWLSRMVQETADRPVGTAKLVFVNSWNEWAEGAMLEPSSLHGRAYLEATRSALVRHGDLGARPEIRAQWRWRNGRPPVAEDPRHPLLVVSHDAARAGGQLTLLETIHGVAATGDFEVFFVLCSGGVLEEEFGKHGHVLVLGEEQDDPDIMSRITDDLDGLGYERRFMLAICNTILTSHVAASCHRAGIPVLSFVWELPTSIRDAFGAHRMDEVVACSRTVVVASEFARRRLAEAFHVAEDRFTPVHIGFCGEICGLADRETARPVVLDELDLPVDAYLVVGCGSIHHRKGSDLFVQVAREAQSFPGSERMVFIWVGGDQCGPTFREWCIHDAESSGLGRVVRFVGEKESASHYLAAADVLLLTSREDPFPRVVMEAMAHDTPVIGFRDSGGAPEALEDGAGILVPYLDVREMARSLSQLCEAPRFAQQIRERIRQLMARDYSWGRYTENILQILEEDFGYNRCVPRSESQQTSLPEA